MKSPFFQVAVFVLGSTLAMASASPAEQKIFDQLNHERQGAGLAALAWDDQVAEAARIHSRSLAEKDTLSHQFAGELTLPERIASLGVRFTVSAENVARTEYVEDAHPALMNSPGHRANMLNPAYNAAGIGVVERKGMIYVTQDFIYQVPMYSEAQFSQAFTAAFNLAQTSLKARAIEVRPDPLLHDLACSTDGDAWKLSGKTTGRYLLVFSSSEPHRLPEQLLDRTASSNFRRLNFGVCFRPDRAHGYANFWVVATLDGI